MNTNEIKEAIVRVVNDKPTGLTAEKVYWSLDDYNVTTNFSICYDNILLAIESGEVVARGGKLWPGEKGGDGWQPIETAPKDRSILGYNAERHVYYIIRWNTVDAGWFEHFSDGLCKPTHWQELTRPEGE